MVWDVGTQSVDALTPLRNYDLCAPSGWFGTRRVDDIQVLGCVWLDRVCVAACLPVCSKHHRIYIHDALGR